jgi:hypothetical protein
MGRNGGTLDDDVGVALLAADGGGVRISHQTTTTATPAPDDRRTRTSTSINDNQMQNSSTASRANESFESSNYDTWGSAVS